ncbi:MAG: hypothetical protein ACRYGK_17340 [Janthinobacterium lividum]
MNVEQFGKGAEFVANAVKAGFGGQGAAAVINPAMEDMYWREQFKNEPYFNASYTYDDYGPAYSVGYNGRSRYVDRFAEAEIVLSRDWEATKGKSRLSWHEARLAALAAWIRIDMASTATESDKKMAA